MLSLHDNLFHYTKLETASEHILPSMSIKMGSFKHVNDPRESKEWKFVIYTRELKTNEIFDSKIFEDISKYITHKSLMLCLTRDDPTLLTGEEDDRDIRVGYAHPRMWSQYGDNHKGVCLVLDREQLHVSIESKVGKVGLFHGPVDYRSSVTSPSGNAFNLPYLEDILDKGMPGILEPHIEKYYHDLFFNKHIDWRDEWEYRWVFRAGNENPIFIPIGNCIKGVILGSDCSTTDSMGVKEYCKKNRIPLFRVHQHGWALSLLPEDSSQEDTLSLSGISYSDRIPCSGVFVQARDQKGKNRTIRIDNHGNLKLIE